MVQALEHAAAEALDRSYAVAVSSGTAALHLALVALDLAGRPVTYPSYACAALPTAIGLAGARGVLCDSGDDLQPQSEGIGAEAAIVPHLFGDVARLPDVPCVIEDIAQAMGGPAGREGVATITSLYATKMIAAGEGGIFYTDDVGLADTVRDLRDYDNRDDYRQRFAYKMTDIQAALGTVQLGRLPEFVARRRFLASRYREAFQELPLTLPPHADAHVYFRFVIRSAQAEALGRFLGAANIEAKRPVYRPAHLYEALCPTRARHNFPGATRAHQEALSLPLYPSLVEADQDRVIDCVLQFHDQD